MTRTIKTASIPDTTPQVAEPPQSKVKAAAVELAGSLSYVRAGFVVPGINTAGDDVIGSTAGGLVHRLVEQGHSVPAAAWAVHRLIQTGRLVVTPIYAGLTAEEVYAEDWPDFAQQHPRIQEFLLKQYRELSALPDADRLSTDKPGRDWHDFAVWTAAEFWRWVDGGCRWAASQKTRRRTGTRQEDWIVVMAAIVKVATTESTVSLKGIGSALSTGRRRWDDPRISKAIAALCEKINIQKSGNRLKTINNILSQDGIPGLMNALGDDDRATVDGLWDDRAPE